MVNLISLLKPLRMNCRDYMTEDQIQHYFATHSLCSTLQRVKRLHFRTHKNTKKTKIKSK